MLNLFTQLLKDYLVRQNIAPANRITLGPPDRAFVLALPQGQSVNVYLADIRENRKLRTAERRLDPPGPGQVSAIESLYPAWVDAHYLITAWDTAADASVRTLREQEVLAAISSALLAGDPFTPREVYLDPTDADLVPVDTARANAKAAAAAAGATQEEQNRAGDLAAAAERDRITSRILAPLNAWPDEFRLPGLPYQVLPPEGFPKLSEFWTTMGTGSIWKPTVYLVAAVPIELKPTLEYPLVTTMKTTVGQTDVPRERLILAEDRPGRRSGTDHQWFQIGGFVSSFLGPRPLVRVKKAKVTLQVVGDPAAIPPVPPLPLQETRTDDDGKFKFQFAGPLPGEKKRFRIVVEKTGLQSASLDVDLSPLIPFPHNVVMLPA